MGILIVEDDYITSKILQVNLEKHGYEVFVVHSGQEALDFLENHSDVQLVMTDIMMPDMDGLDLIAMLKERIELQKVPFIVCSSKKEKETVQRAAALGCTDYILKPFNSKELINKISRIMRREKQVLREKNRVRMELSLNYAEYAELAERVGELVNEKIIFLENEIDSDNVAETVQSLLELTESTGLIGAERLKDVLDQLKAKIHAHDLSNMKDEFPSVLRELHALQGYLTPQAMANLTVEHVKGGKVPGSEHVVTNYKISYDVPETSNVKLTIQNPSGEVVRILLDQKKAAGTYTIKWDGRKDRGGQLEPGTYTLHLMVGSNTQKRRLTLS